MSSRAPRTAASLAATLAVLLAAAGGARAEEPAPLTLPEAIARALRANEVPQIAAARIDQARAARREAVAELFPALAANATYARRAREVSRTVEGRTLTIQARDALSGQAVADALLFDATALLRIGATGESLAAQELDAGELARGLAFDVAETFLAALSLERVERAAERRLEVARAVVDDARNRFEAGLAGRNELTRSELELASAELALTQVRNGARKARIGLSYLLAGPADGPLAEPPPVEGLARDAAAVEREAVTARRDLAASERRTEAERLRTREQALSFVPTLLARGTYRVTNETGLSGNDSDWNVALLLDWQVLDPQRAARVAGSRARHAESRLVTATLRRQIGTEVKSALADLETAEAATAQAEVQRRVAVQNAEEVRERFAQGLATALEQADANVAVFEAEASAAQQRFNQRLAELAVVRAMGGWPPGSPPFEEEAR